MWFMLLDLTSKIRLVRFTNKKLRVTHFNTSIVVITGASSGGYGAAVALGLARGEPKRLILAGRVQERIQPTVDEIKKISPSVVVEFVQIDLLDISSVRNAAERIRIITNEIHGLINNAGIMAPEQFGISKDGIERQFASNHIGHFLLTNLLKDQLAAANGVVNNVSSRGYMIGPVDFEDPNFQVSSTDLTRFPVVQDVIGWQSIQRLDSICQIKDSKHTLRCCVSQKSEQTWRRCFLC